MIFILDTNVLISASLGEGVLELAVSSVADALVTRDGDLLTLNPFRGIPIITVTSFSKLFI